MRDASDSGGSVDFSRNGPDASSVSDSQEKSSLSNRASSKNPKKRERRSKDDNYQRNYVCGCGKSYLSYAALYTHAKTKHGGNFPEGTTTLHKKKLGRPKKDDYSDSKATYEMQRISEWNKDFQHFLEMIPNAKTVQEERQKKLIDEFPCDIFSKPEYYEKILVNLEEIRKELIQCYGLNFLSQFESILSDINNIKRLNCNETFALFLAYSFKFVSIEFYREIAFFVVGFRHIANKIGWDIYREEHKNAEIDFELEFCQEQNAELLPNMSNEFIVEFLPECFFSGKLLSESESLTFFGSDAIRLLRMILMTKHFCHWLFVNKFSKSKIEIVKE